MKRNPKRVMRTVISLVLSLMMVLGMATTAFAAPKEIDRADIEAKVVELYGMLEDYCAENADAQAALDSIKEAVASEEFEEAKAELEAYYEANQAEIDAIIEDLIDQVNALNAYLYDLKAELEADSEVQAAIDEIIAQIESLEDEIEAVEAQQEVLAAAAEDALAAIDEIIAIATGESEGDLVAAVEALQAAFEDAAAAAEAIYNVAEDVVAVGAEILEEVEVLVDEVVDAAPEIVEAIETAVAAIEDLIAEYSDEIEAFIDEVMACVEELIAEIEAAIEEAIAYIEAKIEEATTCDYEINKDSYYVAIGDAVAEDYAKLVAAELGVPVGAIDVDADDLVDRIEAEKAEITKADLITLGYGNAEIIDAVLEYVGNPTGLNWAKYVGSEYAGYVDEAIAAIKAELAKYGIEGEEADMVIDAVEAYAYEYTALLCSYPEAVEAIKAINPEAQIIIVGMHNPLAGLVVDIEGTEVPVGDYVDYLIAASNAHYFGYALLTGNAIYVDAPDAAIGLDADKVYGYDDLLGLLADEDAFYPTAEGNAYIAEQILNAMNITVAGLLGDADGDGYVLANDAMLVLQYSTGVIGADALNLNVCDVDGDGEVLANDAMMILQYSTGVITVFPIEK